MAPASFGPGLRPIDILLVEDNQSDRLLATVALEQARLLNNLHVVDDGVEAMAFIQRQGKFADAPRPDLILLDLNLPRKDGRDVLKEIKSDPRFSQIPVVILTSSKGDE